MIERERENTVESLYRAGMYTKYISIYSSLSLFFLTGEKLVNFLAEPKKGTKWPSYLPKFGSRQEAIAACKELAKHGFFVRSEKRGKGELGVSIIKERRM